ncbi:MAG: hypothetical protein VR65_26990 [Desulfobulbaceae bacterium BRH_c16a]|nr:MAG: hypothetical protein VR65_26990 [Desulfobulbaceae bacterium BRH_c16a]
MCSVSNNHIGTSLHRAVAVLRQGGIVAFPTETFYGLAVDPGCESAVAKLFQVKQRPAHKPLLVLIDRREQLSELVSEIPPLYRNLMEKFWPGPLTLVFPARKDLSRQLTGDTGTIGVRISPHPIALKLIGELGKPVTATSANLSGQLPAKTAYEVFEMFRDTVDYILDGGETAAGLCSTIVGLESGSLTILRQGQVDVASELIEKIAGNTKA